MSDDERQADGAAPATAGPAVAVGTEIAGYRIESMLGRGAMSVVYLAEDRRLQRKVALKLLAPELERNRVFRQRFLSESQLAASLDHPNVVPIYEAGEADGFLFIAMRYVDGSDLKRLLGDGPLPAVEAIRIAAQIAGALDAAHARGLVHRDVKPSNVLVDSAGHAYLGDFGLTKRLVDEGSAEDGVLGTIDYVAPEQIRGEEVDGRADVYSLGCLLYECLTGKPPFSHASEVAVLFAHLDTKPPAPPGLRQVLPKALAKDPDDRYPSCGELVEAARQELGLAPPKPSRRRLAAVAGALVLIGAALLAVFLLRGGSPGSAPVARDRVLELDAGSGRVGAALPAGTRVTGAAVSGGAVWLSDAGAGALIHIDTRTHAVKRLSAQGTPYDVAANARFVATANGNNGTVAVFAATTGQLQTIAHIAGPGVQAVCDVALDGSKGWATDCLNGRIVQFDAETGRVLRRVSLPPPVQAGSSIDRLFADIAVGEGAVWIAGDVLDPTLYRVDRVSGAVVARIRVPAGTVGVAVGSGAVWLTNQLNDSVVRVDPRANRVAGRVPVGREPVAVAVRNGSVWTANAIDGTVSRIDPSKAAVVRTVDVGSRPVAIAVGADKVWVAEHRR